MLCKGWALIQPYFGGTQREEDAFFSLTRKGEVKNVFSSPGQIWEIFIRSLLALTLVNFLLKCWPKATPRLAADSVVALLPLLGSVT